MIRGACIAGLAMSSTELPTIPGFLKLENPEVKGSPSIGESYSLEDVAEFHLKNLEKHQFSKSEISHFLGMSMGGMILSILASKYRSRLPAKSKFVIFVSSANLQTNPAMPETLLKSWFSVKPGVESDFERILRPMFSETFAKQFSDKVKNYVSYRTKLENGQTSEALIRQIKAIKKFEGAKYFSTIDSRELILVSGSDDQILGPSHANDLIKLNPAARHVEISAMGHMINIERPDLFIEYTNAV